MPGHYLALLAPSGAIEHQLPGDELERHALEAGLRATLALPGFRLFAEDPATLVTLPGDRGAIVGTLFDRFGPNEIVRQIDAGLADEMAWSRGGAIIDRFWGRYVAFLRHPQGTTVLRDPSGSLPAFSAQSGDIRLCFSDLQIAVALGLLKPALDPHFVRHWLAFPQLQTGRTGATSVAELLPGTRMTLTGPTQRTELAWDPWTFAARGRQLLDPQAAGRSLRTEAQRTVGALAKGREPMLLELSGGLDSSIVAACLAAEGIVFSAVNYATRAPDGDERRYARLVAEAAGAPLREIRQEAQAVQDITIPEHSLRPGRNPILRPLDEAFLREAERVGAETIFSGAGGDNVFCYLTTAAPALDAWRMLGSAAGLRALRDVAALGDCTLWTAARFAHRKWRRRAERPLWQVDTRFLLREAAELGPDPHPWLDAPVNALPGKREHVESILRIFHFLDPPPRKGPDPVYPLLAQPLLELCLAIPTWMWIEGGRNRAVARHAFSDLLPAAISSRRMKGRLESMTATSFAHLRPALRDLLLSGRLAALGIIDLPSVRSYLAREGTPGDGDYFRILDLATLELWLRAWNW